VKITIVPPFPPSGVGCYRPLRSGGRMTCCSIVTTIFILDTPRRVPNRAFHRTLHLRQRNPMTGINFIGDTLPRARRGITRAVKAPGSSTSCSTYANLTAVCIYVCIYVHPRPPACARRASESERAIDFLRAPIISPVSRDYKDI